MTKRMLIDATHAEETRVVVLDGSRLEDFDVETSTKKQLKGNIYLAKVVRVEPSLQAAFVEYGGGRHGFLAFGEIHPDYYQIPIADRQRLLELQAEEARAEAEAEDAEAAAEAAGHRAAPEPEPASAEPVEQAERIDAVGIVEATDAAEPAEAEPVAGPDVVEATAPAEPETPVADAIAEADAPAPVTETVAEAGPPTAEDAHDDDAHDRPAQPALMAREERFGSADAEPSAEIVAQAAGETLAEALVEPIAEVISPAEDEEFEGEEDEAAEILPPPETIGGDSEQADAAEEARARRTSRFLRNYRIQEVIKRRQILLVQVVKEERGTKGAALTTYISLAGRYCVLMPNSPRGGGISRKITSAADRRRLKEITAELDIPDGMGLIVRTAGANRPKAEIKRDCEYLMRLWDDIREHTMRSVAPALIYEEASLIKRAIRDVYSRDIDEVICDGDDGWKAARDYMRMLMPSHARKVQLWRGNGSGPNQPLFAKYQVEAQLDAMLSPTVQLRSGGYLVINQTEALVAIDVNSGRATRERGIEETALRTNLEAADEVARQLRLRDLAGLIVIDFIDMEARKHNAAVERRLKDALKVDRARIQVGHISHFGLMEMSRQRLRPSLAETSFVACPHCGGLGHVRSTESAAIHVLRGIDEEGAKGRAALVMVHVASGIALYLLNHKRERLAEVEARYAMQVHFTPDDSMISAQFRIDRLKPQVPESEHPAVAAPVAPAAPALPAPEEDVEDEEIVETEAEAEGEAAPARAEARPAGEDAGRRRRRRRRRGGRRDQPGTEQASGASEPGTEPAGLEAELFEEGGETGAEAAEPDAETPEAAEADLAATDQPALDAADLDENGLPKPRRRGRRGGRRRRGGAGGAAESAAEEAPAPVYNAPVYNAPVYTGPTPADPFGSGPFDIFDMLEQDDEPVPARPPAAVAPPPEPEPVPVAEAPLAVAEPPVEAVPIEEAPAVAEAGPAEEVPVVAQAEPPAPPPEPEPAPHAGVLAEPVVGPAIKPLVIGQDELPAAERKRGWWRR